MKFLKWLFLLLGLAGLITGGVLLANVWIDLGRLWAAVRGYNTGVGDPTKKIMMTVGLGTLGGLLLGIGLGLPGRTSRSVRNQYKNDLEARGVVVDPEKQN